MAKPPKGTDPEELSSTEDFGQFFAAATERGAALSAIAQLDSAIGDCLKLVMIQDKDAVTMMFGEQGFLNGFGARVRFSYLLGLIDKFTYDELLIINRVRNCFAHTKDADDFSFPRIQGLVSNIAVLRDPELMVQYMTYYTGRKFDYPPLMQWRIFSSAMSQAGKDLTIPNWAFILEVTVFTGCFINSFNQSLMKPQKSLFP